MDHLKHYAPKGARIKKEGILTLATLPPDSKEWDKYKARAKRRGMTPKQHLIDRRGENALMSVSLLFECPPVDDPTTNPSIVRFCNSRDCYEVDYPRLLRDRLILEAWLTIEHPAIQVDPKEVIAILAAAKKDYVNPHDYYPFAKVAHAIVAVKRLIPPKYVHLIRAAVS
jgi:hypothetical protein